MTTTTITAPTSKFRAAGNVPDLRSALTALIRTDRDYSALIARMALGVMIIPHGAQKLLGWFGGYGFDGSMGFFTETLGIPWALAFLAIAAEFFGGIGLITGALGRVAALGVGGVMAVAALMVHVQHGFFMNWTGAQAGEGIEFHLLAVALAAVILLKGSGALSLDRLLVKATADDAGR